jgi:hypothetical protein
MITTDCFVKLLTVIQNLVLYDSKNPYCYLKTAATTGKLLTASRAIYHNEDNGNITLFSQQAEGLPDLPGSTGTILDAAPNAIIMSTGKYDKTQNGKCCTYRYSTSQYHP